jgi:addiction module HigA family antidote
VKIINKDSIKPVHPGTILLDEFLIPLQMSQYRLAKEINVPARRINEIIKHKRSISVDTALRLSIFFNMSASFWIGLQKDYELDIAKHSLISKLQKEIHPWTGKATTAHHVQKPTAH